MREQTLTVVKFGFGVAVDKLFVVSRDIMYGFVLEYKLPLLL